MQRQVAGSLRFVRGAIVSGLGSALALAGHSLGGGSVAVKPSLLVSLGLAVVSCIALSDREWSLARLLLALCSVEGLLHLTFWLGHGSPHGSPLGAPHGAAGTWRMLVGHLMAALLTAVQLRCGERLLWRLIAAWQWTAWRSEAVRPPHIFSVSVPTTAPTLRKLLVMVSAVSWRGPPAMTS